MFLKELFRHWAESLRLLKWSELKLFILATLNNFRRTMLLVLKNFWWLVLAIVLISIPRAYVCPCCVPLIAIPSTLGYSLAITFFYFFCLLASRASIETKDKQYFFRYLPKYPALLLYLIIGMLPIFLFHWQPVLPSFISKLISNFILICMFFSAMFFADTKSSISSFFISIINGLKMGFFFLPAVLITLIPPFLIISYTKKLEALEILSRHLSFLSGAGSGAGLVIAPVLLTFLMLISSIIDFSLISIFYLKIKHSYYKLFFK